MGQNIFACILAAIVAAVGIVCWKMEKSDDTEDNNKK